MPSMPLITQTTTPTISMRWRYRSSGRFVSGPYVVVPRRRPVTSSGPQVARSEAMYKTAFSTMGRARSEIFRWLTHHNPPRRHSAPAYLSPMEFEQQHPRWLNSHRNDRVMGCPPPS